MNETRTIEEQAKKVGSALAIGARVGAVMCVCPTHRDRRELAPLLGGTSLLAHDYASNALEDLTARDLPGGIEIGDIESELEALIGECGENGVVAIISTDDYPGSLLAAIVADELGLPGMPPLANLHCQHKFLSRQIQVRAVPAATPAFQLLGVDSEAPLPPDERFPLFVKPVKSFFSVGAQRIDRPEHLRKIQRFWAGRAAFFEPFERLLGCYREKLPARSWLIAEDLLEGVQVTLDGYVWRGEVFAMGVVDSIMFPGTLAFQRFEYPSSLSDEVQQRMIVIAAELMPALGFTHGQFNIEFIYNPSRRTVHIVEINPRMSSQFADLFEKVDGANSYSVLIDLAFGRRPVVRRRRGRHRVAMSCVLRRFTNALLRRQPPAEQVAALVAQHPDLRVELLATEGLWLSQQMQDTCSYRYGMINLGADSRDEALRLFENCRARLTFDFLPL